MWHPFDIMPQELAVAEDLRAASPDGDCRLVYAEHIVRWFKDKSSTDTQWPPTVDKKPGVTIEKRTGKDGTLNLNIEQIWQLTNKQTMRGEMTCRGDAWRSPLDWTFQQSFLNERNKAFVPNMIEQGNWKNGVLTRVTKGTNAEVRKMAQAAELASTYALMASFPHDGAISGSTGLLQEGLLYSPEAELVPCAKGLHENALAQGLRGIALKNEGGYPADYWINPAGVVIYVCYGPNRAFVLEKLEALS